MRVQQATYTPTGKDSDRHEIGSVTVHFSNARAVEFDDVRRDEFEAWSAAGYAVDRVPYDMAAEFHQHVKDDEEDENEGILEDDEEDEESHIREDDHLGQVTGIPSPGFEPEEE
jgi:hypothetical protein